MQKAIITTIENKQLMHVMHCNTAFEMWRKLQTIYERNTEQQKCNLLQEFFGYTYDKKGDIATHVSKLENIAHHLGMLQEKISNEMLVSKILATVSEQYRYFTSTWESTSEKEKTLKNLTATDYYWRKAEEKKKKRIQ